MLTKILNSISARDFRNAQKQLVAISRHRSGPMMIIVSKIITLESQYFNLDFLEKHNVLYFNKQIIQSYSALAQESLTRSETSSIVADIRKLAQIRLQFIDL